MKSSPKFAWRRTDINVVFFKNFFNKFDTFTFTLTKYTEFGLSKKELKIRNNFPELKSMLDKCTISNLSIRLNKISFRIYYEIQDMWLQTCTYILVCIYNLYLYFSWRTLFLEHLSKFFKSKVQWTFLWRGKVIYIKVYIGWPFEYSCT